MENVNGLSDHNSFSCTGRCAPLSPYPFPGASAPYSDPASSAVESKGNKFKISESVNGTYHQRGSSEIFLPEEEQPPWLDDLLDDSEPFTYRGHRRSASDSYAYFGGGEAANTLTSKFVNLIVDDSPTRSSQTKPIPLAEKNNQELDESSSQSTEGSGDRASGAQAKPSGLKPEPKRAKQHNAQRSRVRKLQYITHLERTVQVLKAEGSEVSAELEFMEQQNTILMMENRALRQRMESISQEQMIKNWEQGMLEREISRLQGLFHLQQQQQLQMHHHQQQPPNKGLPKHRRNRSKDLDHQIHKNKDICSNRDSVSGPIRA